TASRTRRSWSSTCRPASPWSTSSTKIFGLSAAGTSAIPRRRGRRRRRWRNRHRPGEACPVVTSLSRNYSGFWPFLYGSLSFMELRETVDDGYTVVLRVAVRVIVDLGAHPRRVWRRRPRGRRGG